jgi:methyl-accepting chemotaxis protein
MLRAAARQQVTSVLEESFFGLANYAVQFLDTDKNIVVIRFLPEMRFRFVVQRPDSDGDFQITETPGERFTTPEIHYTKDLESVLSRLAAWAKRLREEVIAANPFARELSAFKEQIEKRLSDMGEELEGFFTNEEAADLTNRLDSFAKKLEELAAKNTELEALVGTLRSALTDLTSSVEVVDRKTWYRMSAGRLLSGLKSIVTSKEARELALEAAKKILLEGPK